MNAALIKLRNAKDRLANLVRAYRLAGNLDAMDAGFFEEALQLLNQAEVEFQQQHQALKQAVDKAAS